MSSLLKSPSVLYTMPVTRALERLAPFAFSFHITSETLYHMARALSSM
jgi:hypothetical protein